MLKSINIEIEMRQAYLNDTPISSIYFGGGTPSLLNKEEIKAIISTINNNFTVDEDAEITVECNPDDLHEDKLIDLKEIGINRLSIGIQSFDEQDLIFMNRSHNATEAVTCINLAKKHGFKNITIDLIYGLPNQNLEKWKKNLMQMFSLDIQHFSAYALTVETKTALAHLIKKQKITPLPEETTVAHFKTLTAMAKEHNFIHYEISNFGKEGYFSNHNTAYWKNKHYLGVGPSAHSFNGKSRQWNVSSNKRYIEGVLNSSNYFEVETLTNKQQYNEYIFTSLRTIWGVNIEYVHQQFGLKAKEYFKSQAEQWIKEGKIKKALNAYTLSANGKLYADAIASDLFIV